MDETNDFLPSANQGHEDHEAPASDQQAPASGPNSELQPLPEQPPKKSKFKIIAAAVIALVALAAGAFYFMQSATADDTPPSASFNTDALKQGFLKNGIRSSATFEAADIAAFTETYPSTTPANATLAGGQWHYVYSDADITFEGVAKSISPLAEQFAISYWSPQLKNFQIWPEDVAKSYVLEKKVNGEDVEIPTLGVTDAESKTEIIPAMRGFSIIPIKTAGVYGTVHAGDNWYTDVTQYKMKGIEEGWNLTAAPKNLHSLVKGHSGKIDYIYEFKGNAFAKVFDKNTQTMDSIKDLEIENSLVWIKANEVITEEYIDPDLPGIETIEVTLSTSAGQKSEIPTATSGPIAAGEELEVFVMDLAYEGVINLTDIAFTRVGTTAETEELAKVYLYVEGTTTPIGLETTQFDKISLTYVDDEIALPEGGATLTLKVEMADALVGGGEFHYEIQEGDITLKGEKEIEFKDTTFPIMGTEISTGELLADVPATTVTLATDPTVTDTDIEQGATAVFAGGTITPNGTLSLKGGKLTFQNKDDALTKNLKEVKVYVDNILVSTIEQAILDGIVMEADDDQELFYEGSSTFTIADGVALVPNEGTPIRVEATLHDDAIVDGFVGIELNPLTFDPSVTKTAYLSKSLKTIKPGTAGTVTVAVENITTPLSSFAAGDKDVELLKLSITPQEDITLNSINVAVDAAAKENIYYLSTFVLVGQNDMDFSENKTIASYGTDEINILKGIIDIPADTEYVFTIKAEMAAEFAGDFTSNMTAKLGFDSGTSVDDVTYNFEPLVYEAPEAPAPIPVDATLTASADVNNAAVEQGELNVVFAGGNIAVDKPVNINEITLEFESNNVKISTILTGARVHINGKVVKGMLPADLDGLKGINALDEENYRYEFVFPVEGTDGLLEGASNEVKVTANIQDTVTANQLIGIKISDIGFDKEVVVKEGTLATAMKKTLAVVPEPEPFAVSYAHSQEVIDANIAGPVNPGDKNLPFAGGTINRTAGDGGLDIESVELEIRTKTMYLYNAIEKVTLNVNGENKYIPETQLSSAFTKTTSGEFSVFTTTVELPEIDGIMSSSEYPILVKLDVQETSPETPITAQIKNIVYDKDVNESNSLTMGLRDVEYEDTAEPITVEYNTFPGLEGKIVQLSPGANNKSISGGTIIRQAGVAGDLKMTAITFEVRAKVPVINDVFKKMRIHLGKGLLPGEIMELTPTDFSDFNKSAEVQGEYTVFTATINIPDTLLEEGGNSLYIMTDIADAEVGIVLVSIKEMIYDLGVIEDGLLKSVMLNIAN